MCEPRQPSAERRILFPLSHFLPFLGSNDICESDLVVTSELHLPKDKSSNASILNLGEENVNLTLKVVNRNEPAYEANVYITHSASLSYVSRRILVGTYCHSLLGYCFTLSLLVQSITSPHELPPHVFIMCHG